MKLLALFIGTAITVVAISPSYAEPYNELEATLYLESKKQVTLYTSSQTAEGENVLRASLQIPAESILSVDIEHINAALNLNQNNPDRIAYPFINPKTKQVEKPQVGWVCGLGVVDILDEDLRATDATERDDFCISLKDLKKLSALESNEPVVLESFGAFTNQGDLSLLNDLSSSLERARQELPGSGVIQKMAGLPMGSPLKNCESKCLVATSEYGMRKHPVLKVKRLHKGIDLRAAIGSQVVSVLPGKVLATRTERNAITRKMKGYGNYVIVVHSSNKMETLYAHLSHFKSKAGKSIKQGELIALSGNTGIGTAPHLHFETHAQGKRGFTTVNPRHFLSFVLGSLASIWELFNFAQS